LASEAVSRAAKKYSFQQRMTLRKDDTKEGAPGAETIDLRRLVELGGDRVELILHDPDDDGQNREGVDEDKAERAVEEGKLAVEDEEGEREDDGRQDELRQEEEGDVLVAHPEELVLKARETVAGERADDDGKERRAQRRDDRVDEPADELDARR
jgi:hypothetical protein